MAALIGLVGKAGAGKDEAARVLVHDHDFAHVKFARILKSVVSKAFQLEPKYLEDAIFKDEPFLTPWEIERDDVLKFIDNLPHDALKAGDDEVLIASMTGKKIHTVRELLQFIGTDVVRNNLDPNLWANLTEKTIKRWTKAKEPVIITDVRFENEAEVIKKLGGTLVRIVRGVDSVEEKHESEKMDFDTDITIFNNGTIEELHDKIKELL